MRPRPLIVLTSVLILAGCPEPDPAPMPPVDPMRPDTLPTGPPPPAPMPLDMPPPQAMDTPAPPPLDTFPINPAARPPQP
jgi:hypothetical protein